MKLAPGAEWRKAPRDLWCTHPIHRHRASHQENAERRIGEGEWMLWIGNGQARHLKCALAEGHAMPEGLGT
jgi:hypothetical protein